MKKLFILLLVVGLASCEKGSVFTANQKLDQYEVTGDTSQMHQMYLKIDADYWRLYRPNGTIIAKFIPVAPGQLVANWPSVWISYILAIAMGVLFGYLIFGIGIKRLY